MIRLGDAWVGVGCWRVVMGVRQKKNLRAHKRASHEDVRFSCPFPQCGGKSFRYKCTLDKHLARVHVNGEVRLRTTCCSGLLSLCLYLSHP